MKTLQEATMSSLNFDGEYGQSYAKSIRNSVPGYDVLHEIALAAINNEASGSSQVLVVGPGPGEELPNLLKACPKAELTVLEPSEQMLSFCTQTISNVAGSERCTLIQGELDQTMLDKLHPVRWDLVICHNVLHLFEADKQISMLRLLGQCTADDGRLILSGYSEPADEDTTQRMMAIGLQRLQNRGVNQEQIKAIRSSRNKVVFSVDSQRVSTVLADEGMAPALLLYQGLFSKLWICTRHGNANAGTDGA